MDQGESVSIRVARKVAECEGIDPVALDPPLHDVIDTDALDSLFRARSRRGGGPDATIEFTYREHTVVVDGSGRVRVTSPGPTPGTTD